MVVDCGGDDKGDMGAVVGFEVLGEQILLSEAGRSGLGYRCFLTLPLGLTYIFKSSLRGRGGISLVASKAARTSGSGRTVRYKIQLGWPLRVICTGLLEERMYFCIDVSTDRFPYRPVASSLRLNVRTFSSSTCSSSIPFLLIASSRFFSDSVIVKSSFG